MLTLPMRRDDMKDYIRHHHRHNKPPVGDMFRIGLYDGEQLVGVGCIGRPIARNLDDGLTVEITRTCTDGRRNANSMIYGSLIRAALALGYKRIFTYTLKSESGASPRAVGFQQDGFVEGREWDCPSRPREHQDVYEYGKVRWKIECPEYCEIAKKRLEGTIGQLEGQASLFDK